MSPSLAWVCAASIGVVFCAVAPVRGQEGARPDSSSPRRVVLSGPVEVPLLPTPGARALLPVVEVMVNGRGPFRFGVETGARFVALGREFADSLGLRGDSTGRELPELRLDSLTLGAARFYGVPAAILPRAPMGVAGVLGLPLYQNLLLTIDYPAGKLRLSRDTLPQADGAQILALRRLDDFWGVPLSLAGHTFDAVLDTRSTGAIGLTPAGAKQVPFEGELRVVGRAGGVAIPMTDVLAGRLAGDATLGRYTFPRPMITVRELPPGFPTGPLIGAAVLQNFVVSLDQRTARLRLEHPGSTVVQLPELMRPPAGAPPGAVAAPPGAAGAPPGAVGAPPGAAPASAPRPQ
jgi:hypothetical protein